MPARSIRRKISTLALALAGALAAYLLLWPVSIDPVAWTPPLAPELIGVYESNERLADVERLGRGSGIGPEDVALDADGRIYAGMEDGSIVRLDRDGGSPEVFARTGGRPAGLRFDAGGNLLVCDTERGLLSIDPSGAIRVLSTEQGGVPFKLADDLDIAADGTVYFTDASSEFGVHGVLEDILEHRPNGRLLAYDPATGETRLVLDGLYFANGVAVSPDQSFVLVCETGTYRVLRHWLDGPKRGETDVFADNLPGMPDGILSNGRGIYWLALSTPRSAPLDAMAPWPLARRVVARLPRAVQPGPERYGFVLGLDGDGRVVHNLQGSPGRAYVFVTNVVERDGTLYLGSLVEDSIGRIAVPGGE